MVRGYSDGSSTDSLRALGVHFHISGDLIVNQGEGGQQVVQQTGDQGQQQANIAGGNQSRVRQTAVAGSSSDSRSGWILIGVAFLLALVFIGLGIAEVVPWEWAGGGAMGVLAVAAVVKFN